MNRETYQIDNVKCSLCNAGEEFVAHRICECLNTLWLKQGEILWDDASRTSNTISFLLIFHYGEDSEKATIEFAWDDHHTLWINYEINSSNGGLTSLISGFLSCSKTLAEIIKCLKEESNAD